MSDYSALDRAPNTLPPEAEGVGQSSHEKGPKADHEASQAQFRDATFQQFYEKSQHQIKDAEGRIENIENMFKECGEMIKSHAGLINQLDDGGHSAARLLEERKRMIAFRMRIQSYNSTFKNEKRAVQQFKKQLTLAAEQQRESEKNAIV